MQSRITRYQKHTANHPEPSNIVPKRQHVETETAQNGTAGDFDVEAVLLVDEREVADFVDDQAFEAEVEDGELWGREMLVSCD